MTATPKFKVGDRVRRHDAVYTVVVAEPDNCRWIVIKDKDGCYCQAPERDFELAPARYVVEVRYPKAGDRFIASGGEHVTADYDGFVAVPVIVDEVTS